MAGNDDFNERLQRIRESRGVPAGGADPGPRPVPSRPGLLAMFPATILVLGAIALAGGFGAYAFQKTQADVAALEAVGLSPDEADQRGFFSRMIANTLTPLTSSTPANGDPILFLPPPPAGWIRVTEIDALDADPMAEIAARWAALDSAVPLDQSLGHNALQQFLQRNNSDDWEARAIAKRRSSALYLGQDGGFMLVTLFFRGSKRSLGQPQDRAAWVEALVPEEEQALTPGMVLERVELAGYPALNRTTPLGKSLVTRPIGADLDIPNGVKLSVPVAPRAVVHIHGLVKPGLAADLLDGFDADALASASDR